MEKLKKFLPKPLLVLTLVVLLGAMLRFYKLGELSFVADEFLDINSSYAYAQTGIWQNWDFNRGQVNEENAFAPRDERAWIYKIQVASLFEFLPPTEGVARSISAAWGVLTIGLIYLVAFQMTRSKRIGLIAAFLFAVSVSALIFDRRLRMYAMFAPLYLAFSYCVWAFLEKRYQGKRVFFKKIGDFGGFNFLYAPLALVLGVLSLMTHQLTGMFVFTLGAYLLVMFAIKFKEGAPIYRKYAFLLAATALALAAVQIFAPAFFASFAAGLAFFEDHWSYLSHVSLDYATPLGALLLGAWGAAALYRKNDSRSAAVFLAASFLAPLFGAIFLWSRNVGPQYIFFAQPFAIILLASGIDTVALLAKESFSKHKKDGVYVLATLMLLAAVPNWPYFLGENTIYRQTSSAETPNYRKVFTYLKKHLSSGDAVIMRNFRNYYLSGEGARVYDFGGELSKERLGAEQIRSIKESNARGFVVLSENDETFLTKEALEYIEKNMFRVSDTAVRGNVKVYEWGK
ncbi:MAG TPA: hypothetical protein PKA31_03075 [Candidatus Moranbacteria bacterium]|nr:hypothetical protein [Candidatus Moranbacteria bacterium]